MWHCEKAWQTASEETQSRWWWQLTIISFTNLLGREWNHVEFLSMNALKLINIINCIQLGTQESHLDAFNAEVGRFKSVELHMPCSWHFSISCTWAPVIKRCHTWIIFLHTFSVGLRWEIIFVLLKKPFSSAASAYQQFWTWESFRQHAEPFRDSPRNKLNSVFGRMMSQWQLSMDSNWLSKNVKIRWGN